MTEDYNLCKKECEEVGYYYPESSEFNSVIANTPAWIRFYYKAKGREAWKKANKFLQEQNQDLIREINELQKNT